MLAIAPAPALAANGGTSGNASGGAAYVATPKIKAVRCVASCMSGGRVQSGGKLKLRGADLSEVRKVVFLGTRGKADDVAVRVSAASDRTVPVPVPMGASSGKLTVYAGRMKARAPKPVRIMPPAAPAEQSELSASAGPAEAGAPTLETSTSRRLFVIDQRGGVKFSYRLSGVPAASVEVALVRAGAEDTPIQTWTPAPPAPGEVGSVSWNGIVRGAPAAEGRYAFRIVAAAATGEKARNARDGDIRRDAFDLRPALFPIKGPHDYGGGGNRFGAGRSGHSHQGQDVMAACGVPLIAARGGTIKASQYHSAAGNYVVIDGAATDVDHAYMHLAQPSPYRTGDRVRTGDQIGVVGTTGSSTACHLHFEMWSGPGWYSGGDPFDPLADLKAWDEYS